MSTETPQVNQSSTSNPDKYSSKPKSTHPKSTHPKSMKAKSTKVKSTKGSVSYKQTQLDGQYDVILIGSGIGSLVTAATLALSLIHI